MRRFVAVPVALALLLLAGWLVSCTSKQSPTAPPASSGELNGSLPSVSSSYAHTFTTAGTFNYECTIHPSCSSLHGVVVVVSAATPIVNRLTGLSFDGGSAGGAYGGASCSSLSSTVDTVHVGDQIIWTNNSSLPHTVTSY